MKIQNERDLKLIFRYQAWIDFGNYRLHDSYNLYENGEDRPVKLHDAKTALAYPVEGKTILEWLQDIEFIFHYSGGNGQTGGELGGGFKHAKGSEYDSYTRSLFPAEFNQQGRYVTQDKAVEMFEKKYKNAKIEYGVSVDELGFVHKHVQGGASSVRISSAGKNHRILHNHPSGGNFSDADLISVARDKNASGMDAIGRRYSYSISKTQNFKAENFISAIQKAQWPKKMSYDQGTNWWLKRNASKLGYSYARRKTR